MLRFAAVKKLVYCSWFLVCSCACFAGEPSHISSFLNYKLQTTNSEPDSIHEGYNKFHHANGQVSSEGTIVNRKPDGYWKTYYENGVLKSEGNRINYKLDSTWKFYDDSARITTLLNYKKGKKNGIQKTFYVNGNVFSEENDSNDIKIGLNSFYYENGKLKKTVPFISGKEEGSGREYSSDGIVTSLIEYKNGYVVKEEKINRTDRAGLKQGKWKDFYASGKIKTEGLYKDNKKQQIWNEYDEYSKLLKSDLYINGELQAKEFSEPLKLDVKRDYYADGTLKSVGTYHDGVKEGTFREYAQDGKDTDSKIYHDGKLVAKGLLNDRGIEQGYWKEFYDDGQLKAEGNYTDGKKDGYWKFYYRDGSIEEEGNFVKGTAEGAWKWYHENGEVLREETYKNGKENGEIKEYDEKGDIIAQGKYENGKKNGHWLYLSPEMKQEGNFADDKEDGEWKHYYDNGKLYFQGSYVNGDEDGAHNYYFEDGNPKEERFYKLGVKEGLWKIYDRNKTLILTINYEGGKEVKYDGIKVKEVK